MAPESVVGDSPEQQVRSACVALRERLRAGESCRSEDFLESRPSLSSHPVLAFELVQTELSVRHELGQRLDLADWSARFPHLRDQLESWFRSHGLLSESALPDPLPIRQEEPTAEMRPRLRFGRYEVLDTLGQGAMGVVYQARDTLLGRVVALKTMRGGPLARPEEIERFFQEARAVALLHHPHVIPLYDFGQEDEQHYLTMALAAGGSLSRRRELFGGDPRKAASLMEKIAGAVHHLHTKGILHRDLKPGNIMLDERGEPLVSDFGLAKFVDADADLTRHGIIVGTPAYMAPELALAQPSPATVRSDVWSLGVILYELLTGTRPFAGTGSKEVSQNILMMEPARPRKLKPKLDRALETIVLKCLTKEPARRYGSAGELAEDLRRWQRGETISARPEGLARRGWRTIRRHALASSACLVLALAAVAVPLGRHYFDPDRPLYAIQNKLARGEPVELIGATGPPAWQRYPILEGVIARDPEPGAFFSLSSAEFCLLELVRDPQREAYTFSAEVRHDTGLTGEVGIYFAYGEQTTPNGTHPLFCIWTFNDQAPTVAVVPFEEPTKSFMALRLRRWNKVDKGGIAPLPLAEQIDPEKQWRKLTVEVRPDRIECTWGKQRFPAISREKLLEASKMVLGNDPGLKPDYRPRGGLGLYVTDGTASFRNVKIAPLN